MKKITLFLLTFFILFSCTNTPNSTKTKIFSSYLQEIDKTIPNQQHLYILAPSLACSGCVQQLAKNVEKTLITLTKKKITIITSKDDLFSEKVTANVNFYLDNNQDLDYLNLDIYNITLFETSNSAIDNIIQLEAEDGEKLVAFIDKYK